jgi:YgiT-type zinc finger domain-containing protein
MKVLSSRPIYLTVISGSASPPEIIMTECSVCSAEIEENGIATQVFRRNGVIVTVTGIPAVAVCSTCGNAILDWEVAQAVEDLVHPLFQWAETHTLPRPVVTVTFPAALEAAA